MCLNGISSQSRTSYLTLKNLIVIGKATKLEARPITDIIANEESTFTTAKINQKEHIASIIYTSGTTGKPKGAMLAHRNLLHNVNSILQSIALQDNDIFFTVLPMFHSFGSTVGMNTPIAGGATIIEVPRFMPEETGKIIYATQATIFMGVPSMYTIFANIPDNRKRDLSSLRICFSGGATLPVEVMKRFEAKYNVPICEGDGPTECSPVTSISPIYGKRKPGSIGKVIPNVQMKIVDQDGKVEELSEMQIPKGLADATACNPQQHHDWKKFKDEKKSLLAISLLRTSKG